MRTIQILGWLFGIFILGLYAFGIAGFIETDPLRFWVLASIGLLAPLILIGRYYRQKQAYQKMLAAPFPEIYRQILESEVEFYQKLDAAGKANFIQAMKVFLAEVEITGVETSIDDRVRVLTAASAVIPIFGFQQWKYYHLNEVLIYPGAFNSGTFSQEGPDRNALGMVGTGPMAGKVILSKPALLHGFQKSSDGHNTGIHEFVHLLDASDGAFDGIPALLDKKYVLPWLGLMHREMKRISKGKSKLRDYGASNKVEFFAVASEFFFERPDELQLHYPKLYDLLKKIFQQDLKQQFSPTTLRKIEQRNLN